MTPCGRRPNERKHGSLRACNMGGEAPDFLTFPLTYLLESSAMQVGSPRSSKQVAIADRMGSGLVWILALICTRVGEGPPS